MNSEGPELAGEAGAVAGVPSPSGSVIVPMPWTLGSRMMPHSVHVHGMIVALLGELPVDVLGGGRCCSASSVAARALVEQVVDRRVVQAAEVQRQPTVGRASSARVPPEVLLVDVDAGVVAPAEGLERRVAEAGRW